ncbi:8-oxo-dGTP diphosphatase [Xylocopilactobacillus apicola]|uniref:7,8-dihydro-8-oxoguanine triphosphatase n=1 Tax=Xylocopilactobacillus apicola TaxID=2932184 RepID=A0AAU9CY23_9LACO|nr:8-oxo-dGTP diphosphatase [Xylocopilactobacillus apicola]BDR58934.1 7,8-dihydro-8-oxoguanine triphosphatase [Xylocopilactobacillus apicola]
MSRATPIELTNMCMITNEKGEVLVEDRLNPEWPGITFPGGHVEMGESLNDAMIREIKEETGLTIFEPKLCGVRDWFQGNERYIVLLYRTDKFSGEIKSSDEGKIFWLEPKKLPQQKLAGGDFMDMYEVFINPQKSEMFYPDDTFKSILY